jgi:hypothetical protein
VNSCVMSSGDERLYGTQEANSFSVPMLWSQNVYYLFTILRGRYQYNALRVLACVGGSHSEPHELEAIASLPSFYRDDRNPVSADQFCTYHLKR